MSLPATPRLVALSNLLWDIYSVAPAGEFPEAPPPGARSVAIAEEQLDRLLGAACDRGVSYEGIGASATNTAAGFAALGGEAIVSGPVTGTPHGERTVAALERLGVKYVSPGAPPFFDGICISFPLGGGERRFISKFPRYPPGADLRLPAHLLEGRPFLVAASYELHDPVFGAFVVRTFEEAAALDGRLVFDCADPEFIAPREKEIWSILRLGLDVLVVDEKSRAHLLASEHAPPECDPTFAPYASMMIVPAGGRGATLHFAGGENAVRAAASKVIDTTGAGDALLAGFLAVLAAGDDPGQAFRFGAAAAAETVGVTGPHLSRYRWSAIRRELEGDRKG